ncbi:MAG: hypothetical protein HYR88_15280, partial [Verrucomicrobia bacterium]|nr:hypothetical protein [Verrucomicrobiota bacterium]
MSGRAYPLFEIASMILKRSDRHSVAISTKKKSDGALAQPLFSCALDDSLWLSDAEAIKHALDNHFATFYQTNKVPVEPPKGVYTFVAQCGISGVILGPPNHHDYQNQLRRLHTERFARMPFDAFKARVKIVRDEAVVKKWVEDQSFRAEYTCLNVAEPLTLATREDVERHFREVHAPSIIRPIDSITLTQDAMKKLRNPTLLRAIRGALDAQRRFPLQVATHLSQQFATRSLQFFKVNKTVTHVSVARPHYLDLETNVVTPGVKKIVDYINANPGCTRRKLIDAMVPGGMPATTPPPPAAAAGATPAADAAPAAAAAEKARGSEKRLVTLVVDAADVDVNRDEPLFHHGECVGYVTSGGYAHYVKRSVALGYVPAELARAEEAKADAMAGQSGRSVDTEAMHTETGAPPSIAPGSHVHSKLFTWKDAMKLEDRIDAPTLSTVHNEQRWQLFRKMRSLSRVRTVRRVEADEFERA